MEAEWRSLGYSMFQSYPPVKVIHIHSTGEQQASSDEDSEAPTEEDGCSTFTKYLFRPCSLDDALRAQLGGSAPTALDYFERVSVVSKPPAAVRSALGRPHGSLNDVLQNVTWPVERATGSAVHYSVISNRAYYYYLRSPEDRCVVRASYARYRTETWYLRLIAMKVPIAAYNKVHNPDPLTNLKTVTDPTTGNATVHTTYQETARAMGLITNDNEGELALIEAATYATPEALLCLFTQVTINGQPTLRVLCGLGLDLSTPNRRPGHSSTEDGHDSEDDENRTSPFDVEATEDDGDENSDGVLDDMDEDAACHSERSDSDSETTPLEGTPDSNRHWQSEAEGNADLERVRHVLLGRYRGSRTERVGQFLLDLKSAFEANGVCPSQYGIPLPPDKSSGPVSRELARWKHDPALVQFNKSHTPRGAQVDVVRAVDDYLKSPTSKHSFKMVYVDGKAGTGKTTTLRFILNKARLRGLVTLVSAPTNLAALLYQGGQSCHALFELLVTRDRGEVVTSRIRPQSDKAELLQAARIIVIDELPSMKRADFEAMLQLLDEARDENVKVIQHGSCA